VMDEESESVRAQTEQCYYAVAGDRFSLQSDVSEGDSLRLGTKIVSSSFFRVPERDRERNGFVAGALCHCGAA
jgi:hypothetical protein